LPSTASAAFASSISQSKKATTCGRLRVCAERMMKYAREPIMLLEHGATNRPASISPATSLPIPMATPWPLSAAWIICS
jgi:hypothetical protein